MRPPLPIKTAPTPIRELVVVSGKGGTGKTSLVASFALLCDRSVLADCDVDAADLHLVLSPEVQCRREFQSGRQAVISLEKCLGCGACESGCRFGAVRAVGAPTDMAVYAVDPLSCEGCGVCVLWCSEQAIGMADRTCGEWMVSKTRAGPMVHAQLGAAAENSGKLVSMVRREARKIAEDEGRPRIIVDGPPGIGCPVIASLTGASSVLVVTEPTVSGAHDFARVLQLAGHFSIPAAVCVNKFDLNVTMAEMIEEHARRAGAFVAGRIRYDNAVTRAQIQAKAVVELGGAAADDVREVWEAIKRWEEES